MEEAIPEDISNEELIDEGDEIPGEDAHVVSTGQSDNQSIKDLIAEGQLRYHGEVSMQEQRDQNVDPANNPNVEYYYKLVAKVAGQLYSIYDGETEYNMNQVLSQPARPGHRGGYYVYASIHEAIFADVPYK